MAQWSDNQVWMDIDALANSYERAHGIKPNRMRLGQAAALEIEGPRTDGHPLHQDWVSPTGGVWFPSQPERLTGWLAQARRQRTCKQAGGHWWHPADAMIAWFCCRCGAERDGMPKDGT
jgi:hypothetical protein